MHGTTEQIATDQIVNDYLDDLEHLLQHADAASVAVMAPAELERTIHALRAILADHPARHQRTLLPLHQVGTSVDLVATSMPVPGVEDRQPAPRRRRTEPLDRTHPPRRQPPMNTTTATTTRPITPAPAGMAMQDYGWEKAVITHWCGVQVVDVHVESTVRTFGPDAVAVTEIILTTSTTPHARTLAVLLDLPAAPPDPAVAWRTWTGWVSVLSTSQPVLVSVTAPTVQEA